MKRILAGFVYFLLAAFLIAFAFAGLDTLYTALPGGIILRGFSGHVDFLARSTVLDWSFIVLAAGFFWLVSLGYSAIKGEGLGFTDRRRAFAFGPAICLLLLVLSGHPVNRYLLPDFFAPISVLVNVALIAVFVGISVLSVIVGRHVAAFFKKRRAKTTAVSAATTLFVLTGIWLISASWPVKLTDKGPAEGPNVIIITIDALRRDRVGAYGAGYVETPNIDRFASKAVRFEEACTPSPWTIPSMYSLISSRYPSVHGADKYTMGNPEITTLAEILSDCGYHTEGHIANRIMNPKLGFKRGFDVYTFVLPFRSFRKIRLYRLYKILYLSLPVFYESRGAYSTESLTEYRVRFL
jgi:hypothetical protein